VTNPFSDVWILILDGEQPYSIRSPSSSWPINLFTEADLRFLLEESQMKRSNALNTDRAPVSGGEPLISNVIHVGEQVRD